MVYGCVPFSSKCAKCTQLFHASKNPWLKCSCLSSPQLYLFFSCALYKQDLLLSAFSTTNTLFCIMSGGDHRIFTNCLLRLRGGYGLAMATALCLILLIQVTSRGNTGYPMATSSGFRSFVDKTVKGKRPHILVSSASIGSSATSIRI